MYLQYIVIATDHGDRFIQHVRTLKISVEKKKTSNQNYIKIIKHITQKVRQKFSRHISRTIYTTTKNSHVDIIELIVALKMIRFEKRSNSQKKK